MNENTIKIRQGGLSEFGETLVLKLQETGHGFLLEDGRLKVGMLIASPKVVDMLLSHDLVMKRGNKLFINTVGQAYIRRKQHPYDANAMGNSGEVTAYVGQHIQQDAKGINKSQSIRSCRYNTGGTSLEWLLKRKGRDGCSLISKEQFLAGERLRDDFILSGIAPHVTMNYDAAVTSRVTYHGGCGMTVADYTIAAKKRLDNALKDAGPGLSDILMRVCCHLDGLEAAEKHLGWPARSSKVVLSIALERLICHYNNHIG